MSEKSLFEKYLFEAPGDDPPDVAQDTEPDGPPDVPDDAPDDNPPDMDDGTDDTDSAPPDMADDFGDDTTGDTPDETDTGGEDEDQDQPDMEADVDNDKNIGLDDKVSAIMNVNLYQRFLNLIDKIGSQMQLTKSNIDIFYSVAPDSISIVKSLTALDENIRLYLKDHFPHENYSKNLLFFNKCLNLLKLINDSFDAAVHKGIRETK